MRTLAAVHTELLQRANILSGGQPSGVQPSAFLRVWVKDSGGTYRDLTTYAQQNMLVSATWSEDVDSVGTKADITLRRNVGESVSLAPMLTASPLNLGWGASSYAALLAVHREVKIEWAVIGAESQPISTDWNLGFHGYIDSIDWGGIDGDVKLACRADEKLLQMAWFERERVYSHCQGASATKGAYIFEENRAYVLNDLVIPTQAGYSGHFYKVTTAGTSTVGEPTWPTTSSATVTSGTATFTEVGTVSTITGTNVETIMQQMLDDVLGAGVVTLFTPSSPGWAIRWFLQKRQTLWDGIRSLVDQIGWDLRFQWDNGSSTFKLTFINPPRSKTTPDATMGTTATRDVSSCQQTDDMVRNAVRVVYSDSQNRDPAGVPLRKIVDVSDATSITKFGRRWMELAEAETSNIDSSAEATTLANNALSDLKDPLLDFSPELRFFPWAQLGDLYQFPGDGLHFDVAQKLAVIGYEHTVDVDTASGKTTFKVRGAPSGGVARHLRDDIGARRGGAHQFQTMLRATATPSSKSVVGGQRLAMAGSLGKSPIDGGFDFHLSTAAGFTPAEATLISSAKENTIVVPDLVPGKTYYWRAQPWAHNGFKKAVGIPTAEQNFVAGRNNVGHYDPAVSQSHYPWNGSFEHTTDDITAAPMDQWYVQGGSSWGAAADLYSGTDANYGRTLQLRGTANVCRIRSAVFPVRQDLQWYNLTIVTKGTGSSAGGGAKRLVVTVNFWKDSAASVASTNLASSTLYYSSGPVNTWQPNYATRQQPFPSDANFCTITLEKEAADANLGIEIGYIFFEEAYIAPPGWTGLAYSNNWTDFGGAYFPGQYMRDPFGFVHLRGLIKKGSGTTTTGETMFTLPTGYRPGSTSRHFLDCSVVAIIGEVANNGTMAWTGANGLTPAYFTLDGIKFPTF